MSQPVRLPILIASFLVCTSPAALAQTEGRVGVGGSVTLNAATDSGVASTIGVGPLVRLKPHKGLGPAGGLNWFRADLDDPAGGDNDFARLRVRPLMGGVSYTIGSEKVLTSFSLVGGPSFNTAEFHGDYVPGSGESLDAKTSFAVRPGVGLTWTVAPRVAIVGFGGYLINRPSVVYKNRFGHELRDLWKADAVVVSIGAVYSLF
jgi:Outer membrane protein beta-barrel domain